MWYQFIKESGRKDIEQMFGPDAYDCVKDLPPKFQPPAAYFSFKGVDCNQIVQTFSNVAKIIEKSPKHTISYSKNGVTFNGKTYTIDSWLDFNEEVDAIVSAVAPPKKEELNHFDGNLPIRPGKINVVKIHNVNEAISYGIGMRWCISQPQNTMWQSYRDAKASTFYFVFDGTKADDDPLRRVVVDATNRGIELTDVNNRTGTIAEFGTDSNAYLQYLSSQGVDISQFQNDPWTPEEQLEARWIQSEIKGLDKFKNLRQSGIPNVFSRYIGRGHKLEPEQFDWLDSIGAKPLITQYVEAGHYIMPEQQQKLDNQQVKTYARARNILYSRINEYHPFMRDPDFMEKNQAKSDIRYRQVSDFSPETINQIRQDPMNFIPAIIEKPIVLKGLIDNNIVNNDYFLKNSKYILDNIKQIAVDNIPYFIENKILTLDDVSENMCYFIKSNINNVLSLNNYGVFNDESSKLKLLECLSSADILGFNVIEKLINSNIVEIKDLVPYKDKIIDYCLDHIYYIDNFIDYGILQKEDLIPYKEEIVEEASVLSYYIPKLIEYGILSPEDVIPRRSDIINFMKLDNNIPELIKLGIISIDDFNTNKSNIIARYFNADYFNLYTVFNLIKLGIVNADDIRPYKEKILEKEDITKYTYISELINLGIFTPSEIHPYINLILENIKSWDNPYKEFFKSGVINKELIHPYKHEIIEKHQGYVSTIVGLISLGLVDKSDVPEDVKNKLLSEIQHGFQIVELFKSGLFTKEELQPSIDHVVNGYLSEGGSSHYSIGALYDHEIIDDPYVDQIKDRLNPGVINSINYTRGNRVPPQPTQPEPQPNLAEASFNLRKYMSRSSSN